MEEESNRKEERGRKFMYISSTFIHANMYVDACCCPSFWGHLRTSIAATFACSLWLVAIPLKPIPSRQYFMEQCIQCIVYTLTGLYSTYIYIRSVY